jgi:hypothetical protein
MTLYQNLEGVKYGDHEIQWIVRLIFDSVGGFFS